MASQQPSEPASQRAGPSVPAAPQSQDGSQAGGSISKKKRKGKKKRGKGKGDRRQSFAIPEIDPPLPNESAVEETSATPHRDRSFYRLGHAHGGNLSETSLESEALLDHRDHPPMRTRRDSRAGFSPQDMSQSFRAYTQPVANLFQRRPRNKTMSYDDEPGDAQTPLLGSRHEASSPMKTSGYGLFTPKPAGRDRPPSNGNSSRHSLTREQSNYDVNNPPSVPSTPKLGPDDVLDDVMVTDSFPSGSLERRKSAPDIGDQLIDIDGDGNQRYQSSPQTPKGDELHRRHTMANPAEGDVCFPVEGMSEIAEEDYVGDVAVPYRHRRRHVREWPDLSVLEDWRREEKEVRSEGNRAKQISEPVLVEGRLRPIKHRQWHRAEEDKPFRFTYFNEEFPSTVHSQTISELLQEGQTFRDLFIPEPPELSDSSSSEDEDTSSHFTQEPRSTLSPAGGSRTGTRHSSVIGGENNGVSTEAPSRLTPMPGQAPTSKPTVKPKRYGSRPTFWLDVLEPTETEMRVIAKAFGIHPLTAEDILMQEPREKVELFRNYYFVNYRSFEQDPYSEDYLEPVNMYVVVFREGVLSFHFSMTPHPANVRRRIRQLKDYLVLSADWISYAMIDSITDAYAPLIEAIEEEVDDIDDIILQLHDTNDDSEKNEKIEWNPRKEKDIGKHSDSGSTVVKSGGDMLRRVGEVRKKVMGLYRLLSSKADVIKGFAKRCNEQWDVAPRSEIGLYLGDIQDHVLTMCSNLSHYESLLSRAHSNYLAQINIKMNERAEHTADVLGKLTVLGTIVLPLNVLTGAFGMNTKVPGQEIDNLYWFFGLVAAMFGFAVMCLFVAKKVYGIV